MTKELQQEPQEIDPVEVALAAMQGILASGVYKEDPMGAAVMAWHLVTPFMEGAFYWMKAQQDAQLLQQQQA